MHDSFNDTVGQISHDGYTRYDMMRQYYILSTESFCPLTHPRHSPKSEKARLFTSVPAVHALTGRTSTAWAGEGVLRLVAGVAGGERA